MTNVLSRAADALTKPRSKRPRPVVVVVAVVLVILLAVWLVAFSPVFVARSVVVRGNLQQLTAAQIRSVAAVSKSTPLIRLDTGAIRKRVQTIAGVAAASVSVSYPATVSITVTERIPVGYLSLATGFGLVDKTGKQFETVASAPARLPHFELAPGADPQPSTLAAAEVAGALPADILGSLLSVSAGSSTAVSLVLRDGRVVRWGAPVRNAEKAQLLIPLLKQPGTTFDISNPELVSAS
jgi:cell division protein FtsQ